MLNNSIIAGNNRLDCNVGMPAEGGFNLVGNLQQCQLSAPTNQQQAAPRLAPLSDYGGPTQTHPPYDDSPVVNAAGNPCPTTDQRGQSRPVGSGCDIGAIERIPSDPVLQRVYLPLLRR